MLYFCGGSIVFLHSAVIGALKSPQVEDISLLLHPWGSAKKSITKSTPLLHNALAFTGWSNISNEISYYETLASLIAFLVVTICNGRELRIHVTLLSPFSRRVFWKARHFFCNITLSPPSQCVQEVLAISAFILGLYKMSIIHVYYHWLIHTCHAPT